VFVELPADLDTPLSAYLRLRPGAYSFLLESVEGGEKWARYSFIGTDPMMIVSSKNGRVTVKRGNGRAERLPDGHPLDAVRDLLREFQPVAVGGLPRFQGGAVGYLAYDMVRHMERIPATARDDLNLPDTVFMFSDTLIVFDNLRHRLIVIANAKPFLTDAAGKTGFFAEYAWILVTFIGVVNATGRVGTGRYSDRIGRLNAYALNGLVSTMCLLAAPWVIEEKNVLLLFTIIGVMAWQYGGTLAVMPAITADYYGPKNLGLNYGLVFIGWGAAFMIPLAASAIQKATGRWDGAFYLSAGLLIVAVLVSRVMRKPG